MNSKKLYNLGPSGHIIMHIYLQIHVGTTIHNYMVLAIYPFCVFFSMKAAELKCQNLIVNKVCQVEHFKTFRKAIGP